MTPDEREGADVKKGISLEEFRKQIETWPPNSYMTVTTGNMQNLIAYAQSREEALAVARGVLSTVSQEDLAFMERAQVDEIKEKLTDALKRIDEVMGEKR